LGVILLEMMSQKASLKIGAALQNLYLNQTQIDIEKFCRDESKNYSKEIGDLLCSMLQIEEKDRIGIEGVVKHPFFQVIDSTIYVRKKKAIDGEVNKMRKELNKATKDKEVLLQENKKLVQVYFCFILRTIFWFEEFLC